MESNGSFFNPYLPPTAASTAAELADAPVANAPSNLYAKWAAVFALNMIVPGFMGFMVTESHGRLGMIIAVSCLLCAGWSVCYYRPWLAAKMIAGAIVIAISQIFPILQITSGIVGFLFADSIGMPIGYQQTGSVTTDLGTLAVTLVTGAILISEATIAGWLLSFIIPSLRRDRRGEPLTPESSHAPT